MPQTVKQAQAAFGAVLDVLQAQHDWHFATSSVGSENVGGEDGLDSVIASTAADLLQLGEPAALEIAWVISIISSLYKLIEV